MRVSPNRMGVVLSNSYNSGHVLPQQMSGISDSPLAPLEKLELMLPGFKGYKRKDLIRQDDVLVRNAVKAALVQSQEEIGLKEGEIAAENPFDPKIHLYEGLLSKLRAATEEIGGAPAGMYSFYARFKLFEEDMQRIVEFDYKLVSLANQILSQVRTNADPSVLHQSVDELRKIFFERQKLFIPEKLR